MTLTAQCISNHIRFTRMILHIQIIVLNKLQPSTLPEIQILLSKDILQTLMISKNIIMISNKILPPCFQCMNNLRAYLPGLHEGRLVYSAILNSWPSTEDKNML